MRNLLRVFVQQVRNLDWLHNRMRILHGDMKPENICLTAFNPANSFLIDFGQAKICTRRKDPSIGSDPLVAPELVSFNMTPNEDGYDNKVDVFSLGATLYEFLTVRTPRLFRGLLGSMVYVDN